MQTVEASRVTVSVGDVVEMKKPHPCGNKVFTVLRAGMDVKLCCVKCGREIMAPRNRLEKNVKKIIDQQTGE